jgi:hypothetical protein
MLQLTAHDLAHPWNVTACIAQELHHIITRYTRPEAATDRTVALLSAGTRHLDGSWANRRPSGRFRGGGHVLLAFSLHGRENRPCACEIMSTSEPLPASFATPAPRRTTYRRRTRGRVSVPPRLRLPRVGRGPETAKAPKGWQPRLVRPEIPRRVASMRSAVARCLKVHDLVLCKCAAARDRDWDYAAERLAAGLVQRELLARAVSTDAGQGACPR